MSKHVAVLMGGWSAEREVSLNSGRPCADAAERKGYKVTRVDVQRNVATVLEKLKPDAALNLLHGRPGEDGTLQGVLEVLGIPYSHSGVLASAVAMQKDLAKVLMAGAGIPVPHGVIVARKDAAKDHPMARPYVLKPIAEGSSVGVFIVTQDHDKPPQELYRADWTFGERLLCEQFIPGRELTCAVVKGQATGVIDIVSNASRFYDYESKYAPGGSTHILPAQIPADVYEEVRRLTLAAHNALGCRGVSRADFRWDESKGVAGLFCLEVNTQPGMTQTSLVPELAAHAGTPFDDLIAWMIEDASVDR